MGSKKPVHPNDHVNMGQVCVLVRYLMTTEIYGFEMITALFPSLSREPPKM